MLDIADELDRWAAQGRAFAVATVAAVTGSAPREPGATLAVDEAGTAIGSISGGCVEGAVYELCRQALRDGRTVLERFDHGDEDAFAAGLTCGGSIDVLVTVVNGPPAPGGPVPGGGHPADPCGAARTRPPAASTTGPHGAPPPGGPVPAAEPGPPGAGPPDPASPAPVVAAALAAAARGEALALATVAEGPAEQLGRALLVRSDGGWEGSLGGPPALDRSAAARARALLDAGRTGPVRLGADGGDCGSPLTLLVESSLPPPRMIVFGAVDFTAALVTVGAFLGYRVTVCDARPVFATPARFPGADEVVVDWPHRYLAATATDSRTVLCVLTHDAKFDVPLLLHALTLPVAYVGAMGSRRTHEDRVRRLRDAGLGERELARLHSPVGLDLGARTPQETALSIAAEIVAGRRGGTGAPLTGVRTPIHHDAPPAAAPYGTPSALRQVEPPAAAGRPGP